MGLDVCGLVRRDHDDLDRGLAAMVEPATPPKELSNLLEVISLALAVHSAAESAVLELLTSTVRAPRAIEMLAIQTRREHVAQRAAAEAMTLLRPASLAWYEHAQALRELVDDHATRADYARSSFVDHVPRDVWVAMSREYATERMRVLSTTSPILVAQRRDALFGQQT